MKTLSEFLEGNILDDPSEELLQRCLANRTLFYSKDIYIYEGSGIGKGVRIFALSIDDLIKKVFDNVVNVWSPLKFTLNENQLNKFEFKKYTDSLDVKIIKSKKKYSEFKGEGWYEPKDSIDVWDDENKKFINGNITIELPKDYFENEKSCADLIEHELNHIVQDYHRRQEKGKSIKLDKQSQEEYIKLKKSSYPDIISRYMKKEECNSYIASIEGEFEKGQKFETYEDAIKWLNDKSGTWRHYKALKKFCEETNDKEIKKLFNKNWSKFINHLYHLLKTRVKSNKMLECFTKEFLYYNIPMIQYN